MSDSLKNSSSSLHVFLGHGRRVVLPINQPRLIIANSLFFFFFFSLCQQLPYIDLLVIDDWPSWWARGLIITSPIRYLHISPLYAEQIEIFVLITVNFLVTILLTPCMYYEFQSARTTVWRNLLFAKFWSRVVQHLGTCICHYVEFKLA